MYITPKDLGLLKMLPFWELKVYREACCLQRKAFRACGCSYLLCALPVLCSPPCFSSLYGTVGLFFICYSWYHIWLRFFACLQEWDSFEERYSVFNSATGELVRLCLISHRKECFQGCFDTFVFHPLLLPVLHILMKVSSILILHWFQLCSFTSLLKFITPH